MSFINALVFCCWVLDNTLEVFKQYLPISSQFCGSEVLHSMSRFSAQAIMGFNQNVVRSEFLHFSEKSASKLLLFVGRNWLIEVTGLVSLFLSWLLAGDWSLYCHTTAPPSTQQWHVTTNPCTSNLSLSFSELQIQIYRSPVTRSDPLQVISLSEGQLTWGHFYICKSLLPYPLHSHTHRRGGCYARAGLKRILSEVFP